MMDELYGCNFCQHLLQLIRRMLRKVFEGERLMTEFSFWGELPFKLLNAPVKCATLPSN